MRKTGLLVFFFSFSMSLVAQPAQPNKQPQNDSNTWLHLLEPEYKTPYAAPKTADIQASMVKVLGYLESVTPMGVYDAKTNKEITDYSQKSEDPQLKKGDFRTTHYEWGITYAGMLQAGEITGNKRFTDYTTQRMTFIADLYAAYHKQFAANPKAKNPIPTIINPRSLDDAGAMCFAMLKATQSGVNANLRPIIDGFINHIHQKQMRLPDGTFARNRPQTNSVWLDDLYMSVPALAQMGKLTGETKYYDDAVKQVLQFSGKMFVPEKGLYYHGWIADMEPHPHFHWARANGWAVMTMVELLDVLPSTHAGRPEVLQYLKAHIKGLAAYQSQTGLWHQLLDKNDSYLESSATAIYVYSIAKAINKGYIDRKAYGPMLSLAWNGLATQVNEKGQIENACVGTSMAFDPAYYYYRPVNVYAAHSYGPFLLAGAEMITFIDNSKIYERDMCLMFEDKTEKDKKVGKNENK